MHHFSIDCLRGQSKHGDDEETEIMKLFDEQENCNGKSSDCTSPCSFSANKSWLAVVLMFITTLHCHHVGLNMHGVRFGSHCPHLLRRH